MACSGAIALGALGAACDDDLDRDPGTPTAASTATATSSGQDTGTTTSNTGAPPPGPSADGWQSDYADGGVGTHCAAAAAEMEAAGVPGVTVGETTIYVGFEQDGQNQNPVFARFDGGSQVYCEHHETEGPDGRAVGITWDGGDVAYVVYTIVGGGSSLEDKGGWLSSYAPGAISGGGPKVSYVGQVEVTHGTLQTGTFIIAVKSDTTVNSHSPVGAVTVLQDLTIEFLGESAHKPIDADGASSMDCTDYPFSSRYRLSPDLSSLVCADCTNCTSQQPCP
jgi:hypothetical protein